MTIGEVVKITNIMSNEAIKRHKESIVLVLVI